MSKVILIATANESNSSFFTLTNLLQFVSKSQVYISHTYGQAELWFNGTGRPRLTRSELFFGEPKMVWLHGYGFKSRFWLVLTAATSDPFPGLECSAKELRVRSTPDVESNG